MSALRAAQRQHDFQAFISRVSEHEVDCETVGYFDKLRDAQRAARMAARDKPDTGWLAGVDKIEVLARDWRGTPTDYRTINRRSQWGGYEVLA